MPETVGFGPSFGETSGTCEHGKWMLNDDDDEIQLSVIVKCQNTVFTVLTRMSARARCVSVSAIAVMLSRHAISICHNNMHMSMSCTLSLYPLSLSLSLSRNVL